MAVRETVVSSDDVVLLSALVEHAKQRDEAHAPTGPRAAPGGVRMPAAAAMNTRVEFEDLESGVRESVLLVHPSGADARAGRISVLSPVGRALLGKRAGQEVDVALPNGDARTLMVITVRESAGG